MALEQNKPIYSPVVIDFITAAAEYCKLVENIRERDRHDFLESVTRILPLVYVKATLLPYMETVGNDALPQSVTEDDYEYVRRGVWSRLRADDDYLEVFTADMQWSEEPVTASVSELLADIYQDLKNFVAVYAGTNELAMNNAVVEVQENFVHYWGQKLVNVMRPLHQLLYAHHHDEEEEGEAAHDHECDCDDPEHCDDPNCHHHHH